MTKLKNTNLKNKNVTQLKILLNDYNKQIEELQIKTKEIEELLKKKSNENEIKNGLYLVNDSQNVLAFVKEGFVTDIFSIKNEFARSISIQQKNDELYFLFKRKKCKLTFVMDETLFKSFPTYYSYAFYSLDLDDFRYAVKSILNGYFYDPANEQVINEMKICLNATFTNLNKLLFKNTTVDDIDEILKFSDLTYLYQMLNDKFITSEQAIIYIHVFYQIHALIAHRVYYKNLKDFINDNKSNIRSEIKKLNDLNEKYFDQSQKVNL